MYQVFTWYTLNLHNVRCQLYLNKVGNKILQQKKKKSSLTTSGWDLIFNLEGWDEVESGKEIQEGGDVCVPMADSFDV